MALLKHTVKTSLTTDAGGGISDSAVYQGDAEVNCSDIAAAGATKGIAAAVDVSTLKSFGIESDQDVTLNTNSHPSGSQTFALVAGKALVWNIDRHDSCPLTIDITKLFFTNGGTTDANVKAFFLMDGTTT